MLLLSIEKWCKVAVLAIKLSPMKSSSQLNQLTSRALLNAILQGGTNGNQDNVRAKRKIGPPGRGPPPSQVPNPDQPPIDWSNDGYWVTEFNDIYNSMGTDSVEIENEAGEFTGYEEWTNDKGDFDLQAKDKTAEEILARITQPNDNYDMPQLNGEVDSATQTIEKGTSVPRQSIVKSTRPYQTKALKSTSRPHQAIALKSTSRPHQTRALKSTRHNTAMKSTTPKRRAIKSTTPFKKKKPSTSRKKNKSVPIHEERECLSPLLNEEIIDMEETGDAMLNKIVEVQTIEGFDSIMERDTRLNTEREERQNMEGEEILNTEREEILNKEREERLEQHTKSRKTVQSYDIINQAKKRRKTVYFSMEERLEQNTEMRKTMGLDSIIEEEAEKLKQDTKRQKTTEVQKAESWDFIMEEEEERLKQATEMRKSLMQNNSRFKGLRKSMQILESLAQPKAKPISLKSTTKYKCKISKFTRDRLMAKMSRRPFKRKEKRTGPSEIRPAVNHVMRVREIKALENSLPLPTSEVAESPQSSLTQPPVEQVTQPPVEQVTQTTVGQATQSTYTLRSESEESNTTQRVIDSGSTHTEINMNTMASNTETCTNVSNSQTYTNTTFSNATQKTQSVVWNDLSDVTLSSLIDNLTDRLCTKPEAELPRTESNVQVPEERDSPVLGQQTKPENNENILVDNQSRSLSSQSSHRRSQSPAESNEYMLGRSLSSQSSHRRSQSPAESNEYMLEFKEQLTFESLLESNPEPEPIDSDFNSLENHPHQLSDSVRSHVQPKSTNSNINDMCKLNQPVQALQSPMLEMTPPDKEDIQRVNMKPAVSCEKLPKQQAYTLNNDGEMLENRHPPLPALEHTTPTSGAYIQNFKKRKLQPFKVLSEVWSHDNQPMNNDGQLIKIISPVTGKELQSEIQGKQIPSKVHQCAWPHKNNMHIVNTTQTPVSQSNASKASSTGCLVSVNNMSVCQEQSTQTLEEHGTQTVLNVTAQTASSQNSVQTFQPTSVSRYNRTTQQTVGGTTDCLFSKSLKTLAIQHSTQNTTSQYSNFTHNTSQASRYSSYPTQNTSQVPQHSSYATQNSSHMQASSYSYYPTDNTSQTQAAPYSNYTIHTKPPPYSNYPRQNTSYTKESQYSNCSTVKSSQAPTSQYSNTLSSLPSQPSMTTQSMPMLLKPGTILRTVWADQQPPAVQQESSPVISNVQSLSNQASPVISHVQSLSNQASPVISNVQSLSNQASPVISNVQSLSNQASPVISNVQSLSNQASPVISNVQSLANSNMHNLPNSQVQNYSISNNQNFSSGTVQNVISDNPRLNRQLNSNFQNFSSGSLQNVSSVNTGIQNFPNSNLTNMKKYILINAPSNAVLNSPTGPMAVSPVSTMVNSQTGTVLNSPNSTMLNLSASSTTHSPGAILYSTLINSTHDTSNTTNVQTTNTSNPQSPAYIQRVSQPANEESEWSGSNCTPALMNGGQPAGAEVNGRIVPIITL